MNVFNLDNFVYVFIVLSFYLHSDDNVIFMSRTWRIRGLVHVGITAEPFPNRNQSFLIDSRALTEPKRINFNQIL